MTAKTTVLIPPDGTPCSAVRITPYPYDDDESDKLCGKAATYCVNEIEGNIFLRSFYEY